MFRRGLLALFSLVLLQQISADLGHGEFRSRALDLDNAEPDATQRFPDFEEDHADIEDTESDSWNPLSGALKIFNDFAGGDSNEEDEDLSASTGTFQDFEAGELPGPAKKTPRHRHLQKKVQTPAQIAAKNAKKVAKINNKIQKLLNKLKLIKG